MGIEHVGRILLWSAALNLALLMSWFAMFAFGRDWMFRMHSRWFKVSPEQFDAIHYFGIVIYKLLVIVFNVVPLLAIWISSRA